MIKQYFRSCWFELKWTVEDLLDGNWGFGKCYDGAWWNFKKFLREVWHPMVALKYGIENLITWLPIIWFDRSWDYSYAEYVLVKKLKLMEECITKYNTHLDWEQDVRRIRFVIDCFERIHKDEYRSSLKKRLEEIYGTLEMGSKPYSYDDKGRVLSYSCEFDYSKSNGNEPLKRLASDDYSKLHRLQEADMQRDYDLAFKTTQKWWKSWWD